MSETAPETPAPPSRVEALATKLEAALGARVKRVASISAELTYEVAPADLVAVCTQLRDDASLAFDMLADVSGIDYLTYGQDEWNTHTATSSGFSRGVTGRDDAAPADATHGRRFAVAYHLLSMVHNTRVRLRVHCEGSEPPMIDSVVDIWPGANWFEREAFDLYGILFRGHPDLRRILTDYGFIGHPFRKDFPLIGHVEVRYDPEKQRVVYEPVSIEPRIQVPRVIRDDHRYEPALNGRATGLPGQKNG
jgi:NADH-quinone oxidoreductase subunit C